MKKIKRCSLFMACILALFMLVGCFGDGYTRERFYGVVRWKEDLNQLVIYIPDVGETAIPESESCIAGFDGYTDGESHTYSLKDGDFVTLHFKYKKS